MMRDEGIRMRRGKDDRINKIFRENLVFNFSR